MNERTWKIVERGIPEPAAGQVLVRNQFVSLDPAMRGWIRPLTTYVALVEVGGVMRAGAVGRVVASRHAEFRVGEFVSDVAGNLGFQDFGVSDGAGLLKVDTTAAPLPAYAVTAHLRLALVHGRMEGFIAYEYADRFESALKDLVGWYKAGQLRLKEEIVQGFEALPECLHRVFSGANLREVGDSDRSGG